MKRIALYVRQGAMAYLRQQYKIVAVFFLIIMAAFMWLAYGLEMQNKWVPWAFISGGFFSALSGFIGMKTATYASNRVAQACRSSLDSGLKIAFRSGAVLGLTVVGLGMLDISVWYLVLDWAVDEASASQKLVIITTTMLTFGMGASLQALFARVGGGIFTKAADVGADLVGKVEANIPEDDPRNPATIADNVGDNVGDVAGMGADLYESYCGSILAAAALGAAAFYAVPELAMKAVLVPMLIAAAGSLMSIVGIYAVRVKKGATQKALMAALDRGLHLSSVLIAISALGILWALGLENFWGLWGAVVVGILVGIIIGKSTEYFTSASYRPCRELASKSKTGAGPVIISGIGIGMVSTCIPVMTIVIGTILAYGFSSGDFYFGAEKISEGLYGIAISAVGMLSTLGLTLATDAYGPISDNAGGNAEMTGLGEDVRRRTDALDSLGNTTAATGKGFAIGSAALTALALLASYVEELRIGIEHYCSSRGLTEFLFPNGETLPLADIMDTTKFNIYDFMEYFQVTMMNPKVLLGIFIGSMMAFLFCGLTMNAVGRAAARMVDEVRRQFRQIKGILTGEAEPDYARCVQISTSGAQKEMIIPSMLAVLAPVATGIFLGVPGVFGLLSGSLGSGFILAIFMANSGGIWDNAKKYIESGRFGGKGSESHKAAVIGDTVGDPFKDTSGPSLNILIKLMSMVSIVTAGVNIAVNLLQHH